MKKIIEISKPAIGKEEIKAVIEVLKSKLLSQGPKVAEFEKKFASYCGARYAVATNSGTSTLHCALYALGIHEGDEVITTPFTFVATANAILMQRAKVVFCDIEEDFYNIDPVKIEEKITKNTKVLIPVDLYGHLYDIPAITELAKKFNLKIIEDAGQAIAAEYQGKKAGSFSDITSFSLYATKNLTAGVGGVITTNNKVYMEKCKLFRHHGQIEGKPYEYKDFGYNYRMNDMIAAIALEQLKKIDFFTQKRRENAQILTSALQGINGLILPKEKPGYTHAFHQYTVRITKDFAITRDEFLKYLAKNGIMCKIYYPKPLHLFPHFAKMGYKNGDFPAAEKVASQVVSIPIHPLVTQKDILHIIKTIKRI